MSKEESNAASGFSAKVDKKRKRQAEDSDAVPSNGTTTATAPATTTTPIAAADGPSKKKQKNKQKLKEKKKMQKAKEQEQQGDDEDGKGGQRKDGIDESIGKMDGRLLVDHFAQKAKRHNKELSAVELNDLSVPGEYHIDGLRALCFGENGLTDESPADSAFLDTSSYDSSRALNCLPEFLKAFTPDKGAGLAKSSEEKGTPHTLVVCGAALRAAEVVRYDLANAVYLVTTI